MQLRSHIVSSRRVALAALAALVIGCSSSPDEGPARAAAASTVTPRPQIQTVAREDDRARFEERVVPRVIEALDRWGRVGLRPMNDPVVFVIAPPAELGWDGLRQVYGDTLEADLASFRARVAEASSLVQLRDDARAFACAHPPLGSTLTDELEEAVAAERDGANADAARALDEVKARGAARLDAIRAGTLGREFSPSNAQAVVIGDAQCTFYVLGRQSTPTRRHSFDEPAIVLHELGHGLHFAAWRAIAPGWFEKVRESTEASAVAAGTVAEAISDVFANAVTGDPCHGEVLNEQGEVVDCRRRMDRHDQTVVDAVLASSGRHHESGHGIRHFFWDLRAHVPEPEFDAALAAGVRAVGAFFAAHRPRFTDDEARRDPIAGLANGYERDVGASVALVSAACAAAPHARACAEVEGYLGAPRPDVLESMVKNAPSTIGAAGATASSEVGDVRVAFEPAPDAPRRLRMIVTLPSGAVHTFTSAGGYVMQHRADASGRRRPVLEVSFGRDSTPREPVFSFTSEGTLVRNCGGQYQTCCAGALFGEEAAPQAPTCHEGTPTFSPQPPSGDDRAACDCLPTRPPSGG